MRLILPLLLQLLLKIVTMCTNEEVEDADAKHVKRDADMTIVVEPVMHAYT